jgi:hypothetical protein
MKEEKRRKGGQGGERKRGRRTPVLVFTTVTTPFKSSATMVPFLEGTKLRTNPNPALWKCPRAFPSLEKKWSIPGERKKVVLTVFSPPSRLASLLEPTTAVPEHQKKKKRYSPSTFLLLGQKKKITRQHPNQKKNYPAAVPSNHQEKEQLQAWAL